MIFDQLACFQRGFNVEREGGVGRICLRESSSALLTYVVG